jgi:hypothetical protein
MKRSGDDEGSISVRFSDTFLLKQREGDCAAICAFLDCQISAVLSGELKN